MRKALFQKAILLLIAILIAVSCTSPSETERPQETWVFRSVIDERPRMLTAALHENLWVSYDATTANLYKAWKGGVNFDGAVYTTVHGPQPTSKGYAYLIDDSLSSDWKVQKAGNNIDFKIQFKGHSFNNDRVKLHYDLHINGYDVPVTISESPEYKENEKGNPGLERIFNISNQPEDVEIILVETLSSLPDESSYSTTGEFKIAQTSETNFDGAQLYEYSGNLKMNPNHQTILTAYFYKPGEEEFEISQKIAESADHPGVTLINSNDCRTCHNETKKTVGPSYLEIAKKYSISENVRNLLSSKIIEGGTGVWGEVPMTAHAGLPVEDAKTMVDYILSLDEEKPEGQAVFLGVSSSILTLDDQNSWYSLEEGTDYPGLAVSVFAMNLPALAPLYEEKGTIAFEDLAETSGDPILAGTIPTIHLTSIDDLGRQNNFVFHKYSGFITVDKERTYSFRLASDDGSRLLINNEEIIDNGGLHGVEPKDGEVTLRQGKNEIIVEYYQAQGGAGITFQWADSESGEYQVVPESVFSHNRSNFRKVVPYIPMDKLVRSIPGDQKWVSGVHPAFDVAQARPESFEPKVGGLDFFDDGRMVVCTWDADGPVYLLEGATGYDPEAIKVTRIAQGLAEPLGIKVVDETIYVLQKHELTRLIDTDGDNIIDEYQTVCDGWKVSPNFHEFAFGLVYKDDHFYATLATAIMPGGASANPQIPDRGKVMKINPEDGSFEFIAHGLRTPNGIGIGVDGELFIADNQGDWLPSSKIVHVQEGAWYGSRSVDFEGTANLEETPPVVWLPQDEIGNSPSQPVYLDKGPYAGQMIHGEVTHGGLKRVYVEKIQGQYQGAVMRFSQGLEAGINRAIWGPDGSLYVGGIGNPGNWSQIGKNWFGLQRLTFNGNIPFEILEVHAKSDGIELLFTEPIAEGLGTTSEEYSVRQWYYLPTKEYGGPKVDLEDLEIASVNVSEDRTRVFLELEGMKEGHMVYLRIIDPFVSRDNNSLWTTEAWYNMNQIPENMPGPKSEQMLKTHNYLTEGEKANGWRLLFDGATTEGWRNYRKETIGSSWKAIDGELRLMADSEDGYQVMDGGDLVTEQTFENFELYLEYKTEEGTNSGIIYNVVESEEYDFPWKSGPEFQILDNVGNPGGRTATHRAGDVFDIVECDIVTANGPGLWNKVRIIRKDSYVEHWQNGYKVLEYDMNSDEWKEAISKSNFKDIEGFGMAKEGRIVFQDNNDAVSFRNIKIRSL
jgi:cytochrome c